MRNTCQHSWFNASCLLGYVQPSNVGLPSVTAWRQTRNGSPILGWCWLNVVDGAPTLVQHWVNVSCLTACRIESAGEKWMADRLIAQKTHSTDWEERTRVNQHVPTSLWEGRHNYLIIAKLLNIFKPYLAAVTFALQIMPILLFVNDDRQSMDQRNVWIKHYGWFRGFVKLKKIREQLVSGWVGQAPTRIFLIFLGKFFFCVFFVLFSCFQMFGFFNLTRPLISHL